MSNSTVETAHGCEGRRVKAALVETVASNRFSLGFGGSVWNEEVE